MRDQADELRALVRQRAADHARAHPEAPHKVVVSGGKGGVGMTTVAVNLAIALARLGSRTVLVDADLNRADAGLLCGVEPRATIGDVLDGRRTLHEVLQLGPAGVLVLPGAWPQGSVPDCSPAAQERLLRQCDQLGRHADLVVFDAGAGLNQVVRRFWQAADRVLLVTTPDTASIMDAYAAIKVFLSGQSGVRLETVVNLAADEHSAAEVHARIAAAARRFLGLQVDRAGTLAADSSVHAATAAGRSLLGEGPGTRWPDIERIAEQIATESARGGREAPIVTALPSEPEIVAA